MRKVVVALFGMALAITVPVVAAGVWVSPPRPESRIFSIEVDRLTEPPDVMPVTVVDSAGVIEDVEPLPVTNPRPVFGRRMIWPGSESETSF